MKNLKLITFRSVVCAFTCIAIASCGNRTPDDLVTNEIPIRQLEAFEGNIVELLLETEFSSVHWRHISGPELNLEAVSNQPSQIIEVPWISGDDQELIIDAVSPEDVDERLQRFSVKIKNRRYVLFNGTNANNGQESLWVSYVNNASGDGPYNETKLLLATLIEGEAFCFVSNSPDGRRITFGIKSVTDVLNTDCRAVYYVDVDQAVPIKVSSLNESNTDIRIQRLLWSPDSSQLYYYGDHGDGVEQHYVIPKLGEPASFLNYHNNHLATNQWPIETLYPVYDGGNTHLDFGEAPWPTLPADWAGNSQGLFFSVYNPLYGEDGLYLSSHLGDSRYVRRSINTTDIFLEVDETTQSNYFDGLDDCTVEYPCVVLPCLADCINSISIDRTFGNIELMGTSVEGHIAFLSRITLINSDTIPVLAVQEPVVAGGHRPQMSFTPIESEFVVDAQWSPLENHLAFTGTGTTRHLHLPEHAHPTDPKEARGPEIPGQLYVYNHYKTFHDFPQERLSRPRDDIDENDVQELEWSDDGQYIAYARGALNVEGAYLTSLWVTILDDIYEESAPTIDANTTLLLDFSNNDFYFTDYVWLPDSRGLLVMVETDDGREIWYASKDGETVLNVTPNELTFVSTQFLNQIKFAEDGSAFAYKGFRMAGLDEVPTLFVQRISNTDPFMVNDITGPSDILLEYEWLPDNTGLLYSVQLAISDHTRTYQALLDGSKNILDGSLNGENIIRRFWVE